MMLRYLDPYIKPCSPLEAVTLPGRLFAAAKSSGWAWPLPNGQEGGLSSGFRGLGL